MTFSPSRNTDRREAYFSDGSSNDGYGSEGIDFTPLSDSDLRTMSATRSSFDRGFNENTPPLNHQVDKLDLSNSDNDEYGFSDGDSYGHSENFWTERFQEKQQLSLEISALVIDSVVPFSGNQPAPTLHQVPNDFFSNPVFDPNLEYFPGSVLETPKELNHQFEVNDDARRYLIPNHDNVLKELANISDERAKGAIENAFSRARTTGEAQFIQRNESGLSRSLLVTASGDIFVVFNRKKEGDTLLGKGHFKKVYSAINLNTGKVFAYLSMKKAGEYLDANQREFELSTKTQIGTVTDSFVDKGVKTGWLGKVMDGDIDHATTHGLISTGTETERLKLALQMGEQLTEFHDQGIIHMDVKPENFLYCYDEADNLSVILGDLGLSIQESDLTDRAGTLQYLSPEAAYVVVYNGDPTRKSKLPYDCATQAHDGWAMGMSLFKLFHPYMDSKFLKDNPRLTALFAARSHSERAKLIAEYWYFFGLTQEKWMKEPENKVSMEYVIWKLLQVDPKQRWTPREASKYIRYLQNLNNGLGFDSPMLTSSSSESSLSSSSSSSMSTSSSPRISSLTSSSSSSSSSPMSTSPLPRISPAVSRFAASNKPRVSSPLNTSRIFPAD